MRRPFFPFSLMFSSLSFEPGEYASLKSFSNYIFCSFHLTYFIGISGYFYKVVFPHLLNSTDSIYTVVFHSEWLPTALCSLGFFKVIFQKTFTFTLCLCLLLSLIYVLICKLQPHSLDSACD